MIHFFRRIRQGLINQERVGKYLLYAIGEIFLVVIGILIALQINNWNDERKSINEEKLLYKSLISDLNEDFTILKRLISRVEKRQKIHLRFYYESILGEEISLQPFHSGFLEPTEIISVTWENHQNSSENISSTQIRQYLNKHFRDYNDALNTTRVLNNIVYNDVRKLMREKEVLDYDVIFGSSPDKEDFDEFELVNRNRILELFGTVEFNSLTVELYLATQDVLQSLNHLLTSNKELRIKLEDDLK